jgi:hypothetical protein
VENVAAQLRAALIVTTPSLQSASPVQPLKVEPLAGAAVSVTTVPLEYVSLQSPPQLIPEGLDVTVPLPVPAVATLSV